MSLADSDFEAVGFDNVFEENAADQPQNVVVPLAPVYRKQEFSIYSFLLIISFLMLVVSIIFLFMEVGRFE
jgi:hypothetical protein